jgi:uncharacterized membrane protein
MLSTNVSKICDQLILVKPLGCGNYGLSLAFFFSFIIIVVLIFLRLFIAITLQAFQETNDRDNKFMNSQLSDHFREVWSKFDPDV